MKILVILVALLSCGSASAQQYAFRVLISKGQNQIRAGNDWLPIKVGANLKSGDELKISRDGYLGLVHVSGKPLEVKESGQHSVVDLAAKIKEGSGVLNKYTDFILSAATEKSNNLTATGSVYRGAGLIRVFLPEAQSAIVFNDEISVAWEKDEKTRNYVVLLNSMFGDTLDLMEVRETILNIDLSGSKLENEDNILLTVSSKEVAEKSSETFMLKKLSAADKKRINTFLAEIALQTKERTALNQLYLASFYENNGLLIDASTAYLNAIALAPNVPDYQEAYGHFLKRNGLKE